MCGGGGRINFRRRRGPIFSKKEAGVGQVNNRCEDGSPKMLSPRMRTGTGAGGLTGEIAAAARLAWQLLPPKMRAGGGASALLTN